MGHAKVDTTLNVYTQVIDGALRAAVDKVGSELFTIEAPLFDAARIKTPHTHLTSGEGTQLSSSIPMRAPSPYTADWCLHSCC
jgi:hypothetical protein